MKTVFCLPARFCLCLIAILAATLPGLADEVQSDFHEWAPTPPMGWNSWDCFATTVTESQTEAEADYMAENLARHGWQYIVVDIQWYEPEAKSFEYRKNARLTMDEYGRLLPATNRFPSAADGSGFRKLADYVHQKGLKFGIHLMRGIPRQAVEANLPIHGTDFHAAEIADTNNTCPWNPDMYGVNMSKPGAQAYYNSVFDLIASWGVDFVKVDDLSRPYHQAEIDAIRRAIDQTGRAIVLSTSPGATPVAKGDHVSHHANLWRISDDFWDSWPLLRAQFKRLHDWTPFRVPGGYPDADMLPLGEIRQGRGKTHFTPDEQFTLMTLWSIARSPLIFGGDMTRMDPFTLSLITNDEVLAVDQHSANNHQLFRTETGDVAWIADLPGSPDKYLAVFNLRDVPKEDSAPPKDSIAIHLADTGLNGAVRIRDLWERKDLGSFASEFSPEVARHGARLFRLSPAE